MTIRTIAALTLAICFAASTQASELNLFDKMQLRNACGPDIEAACGATEPGEGRIGTMHPRQCRKAVAAVPRHDQPHQGGFPRRHGCSDGFLRLERSRGRYAPAGYSSARMRASSAL